MNTINVDENRFLRHWLVSSLGAWPTAAVACLIAWLPIAILSSLIAQFESLEFVAQGLLNLGIFIIPGLSIGFIVGDIQYNLLRDFLDWTFIDWIKYSAIGGLVGGMAVFILNLLLVNYLPQRLQWMMVLPVFILPLSLMQWRLLRTVANEAWMWVLANLTGAIVFSGLLFNLHPLPFIEHSPLIDIMMWILAASSFGFITGIVMLWLYERPLVEWDDEDAELAPVYIEVRNRDDR